MVPRLICWRPEDLEVETTLYAIREQLLVLCSARGNQKTESKTLVEVAAIQSALQPNAYLLKETSERSEP